MDKESDNLLVMELDQTHHALMVITKELYAVQQRVAELEKYLKSQPKFFYKGDEVPAFLQDENC